MSKLSNILLMLQYLENGKKYSISELSTKLEVSPRMVRVYKEELEKAGIYIDTIMGPYGGYVLKQNVRVPSRVFDLDDYLFLHNLEVSSKDRERLSIISDKVRSFCFDSCVVLDDKIKNFYNTLARGIKEKRKVLINYNSYNYGYEDRIIRPYDLFLYEDGWGCAAFCEKRGDLRHFDLARIKTISLLDEKF